MKTSCSAGSADLLTPKMGIGPLAGHAGEFHFDRMDGKMAL